MRLRCKVNNLGKLLEKSDFPFVLARPGKENMLHLTKNLKLLFLTRTIPCTGVMFLVKPPSSPDSHRHYQLVFSPFVSTFGRRTP